MKKIDYKSPQVEAFNVRLEQSILSNVQRTTNINGNGWYDDEEDY